MVGVPKSTGCAICRKRKVKCDETWPTCVNCRKNGKLCPGPPSRHTFRDAGPQLDKQSTSIKTNQNSAPQDQVHQKTQLTHLKAIWSNTGAAVLKFRLSPTGDDQEASKGHSKGRSPTEHSSNLPMSIRYGPLQTSPHHELARALIEAMETDDAGYSISDFGSFMHEVPCRIGRNAALDTAVACLLRTRSALLSKNTLDNLQTPKYYLAAVQRLQRSLEDPVEGMSSNTLCAAVILSLVEALAGPRLDNSYLAHIGGAGRLLEIQGPQTCRDGFAKEILRFTRGGIIVTSIYKSEPSFLSMPGWRHVAFDNTKSNIEESLYTEVLHLMSQLSVLLKEVKELQTLTEATCQPSSSLDTKNLFPEDDVLPRYPAPHTDFETAYTTYIGPELSHTQPTNLHFEPGQPLSLQDPPSTHPLLEKAYALKASLDTTSAQLQSHLQDGTFALPLPALDPAAPFPTAYRFPHWRTARIYTIQWSLTILVAKTLLKLLPEHDPVRYALEAECRAVALEICKTWDNAWANRPIGACHVWLGFVVAYEFCSVEARGWVLGALNRFLMDQGVEGWRWTEEVVGAMNRRLMGEGEGFVSGHGSGGLR
ncbi:uncharacterized protein CC84DRAFT_1197332 [Paraphaeosphaeria sporulosa]|uniref:Zn(2)-C6 fungal-type domain-containing protein n=1 Tax=Paraphaeosphaeria sporulosa TaxID=1460663 RepID=A0A177CA49_9PLEO|nr:uncharacterized protein CC84DRAFT_1197332 [Paraphaeosphaeria sporulosa]OAG03637.1 hypothetical protein CC84DRAFT_1197332 [Paraphaeosphaeria sporulosa]